MAIPKFHQTFLPILKVLKDGEVHKSSDLPQEILENSLVHLTDEELSQEHLSGGSIYHNRVGWGISYLNQAKFVTRPSRGMVKITDKGINYLSTNPDSMSLRVVKTDDDYLAAEALKAKKKNEEDEDTTDLSPTDLVEKGFRELEEKLTTEILEKLHESNPYYFERIVLVLFKKMGYGDFQETAKSGDGGIDGIINQDQLGIEKIYIQAKRYSKDNKVREPQIRNFIGAISGHVSKGIFVTTSSFDEKAVKRARDARNNRIILVDGEMLAKLMIKFEIGVQAKTKYVLKEIDEDFFELG